jgi:hypothetical protein
MEYPFGPLQAMMHIPSGAGLFPPRNKNSLRPESAQPESHSIVIPKAFYEMKVSIPAVQLIEFTDMRGVGCHSVGKRKEPGWGASWLSTSWGL